MPETLLFVNLKQLLCSKKRQKRQPKTWINTLIGQAKISLFDFAFLRGSKPPERSSPTRRFQPISLRILRKNDGSD
jgi:hypothetical protein